MIPTIAQVYDSTVCGLNSASRSDDFGRRLLISGKLSSLAGARRENWPRDYIANALCTSGFAAVVERERIDISLWPSNGMRPLTVIEVKFLYTHGRPYFRNIWYDFLKRSHYGAPQYSIMLGGNYLAMPGSGGASNLYGGSTIGKYIKRGGFGFDSFEIAIDREFAQLCEVHPGSSKTSWSASYAGASMLVRAWVLVLRPGVLREQLVDRFRMSTSATDFQKRINQLKY